MTKAELNRFKQILEEKQAELAKVLRKREGIAIEKAADALDEVQYAAERELAIRNLDRESQLFRQVRAALRRIDEGTFGVCVHCDQEISQKRLQAVPWAAYCLQCQEIVDRQQERGEEILEEFLVDAA
ncbi:MAG: TraR/DksA C4-type zinc finger protein [Bryobacterales bacterium]|nr:TraR/DksA C4-type zinc finger protein [Bryobacteraceae bacterium]MDW8355870.1 TraR/DksA C4-type zinc finger protein [Bryobacterales bacterium]